MQLKFLKKFIQPKEALHKITQWRPWVGWLGCGSLLLGVIDGLWLSPSDYQQGDLVRIMYVHVPAAWWGMAIYALMAGASILYLVARVPFAGAWAVAMAPIGMGMTGISLLTGAIWGQPTWGTWWVWDARLTSMFLLLFLYIGYIVLSQNNPNPYRGHRAASFVIILGVINLPIIKWSVNWWYTLHQPASILRVGGPAVDPSMLRPLATMAVGFGAYALWLVLWRLPMVWEKQRAWMLAVAP